MCSNISDPLPEKSDNPSITVRKTSGDLDNMGTKPNVVKDTITATISKNNIDTVNKTEKSQASNKTVDTYSSNKSDKSRSLDK